MCFGLHRPEVQCPECGTPRPCLVTDFYDWLRLRESIVAGYRSSTTEDIAHTVAVALAASANQCSERFVLKTLRDLKVITS